MLINVPQNIDVEDKIAGPLTAKQLGWIVALGIILMFLWNVVPKMLFFILGFPLTVFFSALAFYKPYGQPLGSFLLFGIMYFFRPKVYFWQRTPEKTASSPQKEKVVEKYVPEKHLTSENLKGLAGLLDSEGMEKNAELEKILKQIPVKK